MTPLEIVSILRTAKSVADFVEGGPLASALADIGLQSATDALDKVPEAKDADAQVWSAVNHLEAAAAALTGVLDRKHKQLTWFRAMRLDAIQTKRTYVYCLMAISYRYLGEDALARRAFERSRDEKWWIPPPESLETAYVVSVLLNPLTWLDIRERDRFVVDSEKIEEAVFAIPPRSRPPQLRS